MCEQNARLEHVFENSMYVFLSVAFYLRVEKRYFFFHLLLRKELKNTHSLLLSYKQQQKKKSNEIDYYHCFYHVTRNFIFM